MPHWSKKSKITLDMSRIRTVEMAATTYPGKGKYDFEVDRIVPFGKFERLIEDGDYKKGAEDWKLPEGRGWWPVCMITWDSQHSDYITPRTY